jgi:glycosyltransferase involved in cell wall biosynthesis
MIYQGERGGEVAGMVEKEGVGIVVPPGDREGLREAVLSLFRDRERCAALGAAARRALEERYSEEGGLAAYRLLLEGGRSG